MPYAEYASQRDAIENALEQDPTLLKQKGILSLYRQLHRTSYAAEQKARKALRKVDKQSEARVIERLQQAEVFAATAGIVQKLHAELFAR